MRILLVEDDGLLGDGFQVGLRQMGFQVDWVREGRAALRELSTGNYDACILDLGLPQLDGMEVLTLARAQHLRTPILILTARNSLEDRIGGLNLGADDYLIKPIDINELIARLRAISRRFHGHVQNLLTIKDVCLDASQRSVLYKNQLVNLSGKEFEVLHGLMLNAGRVLSRGQLEQRLYSWGHEVDSNAVEVHIHHLRKKLAPELIQTVERGDADEHHQRHAEHGQRQIEDPAQQEAGAGLAQGGGEVVVLALVMHRMRGPQDIALVTAAMQPVIAEVVEHKGEHPGPDAVDGQFNQRQVLEGERIGQQPHAFGQQPGGGGQHTGAETVDGVRHPVVALATPTVGKQLQHDQ